MGRRTHMTSCSRAFATNKSVTFPHLIPIISSSIFSWSVVQRGNWALFNDLDGPLDLYTPTGHEARNDEQSGISPYKGEG